MKYSKYSIVIIGSGISGLYLANSVSKSADLKDGILIVTKNNLFSGSSALAQGGMVSVIPELNPIDSIESHIKDTIQAGWITHTKSRLPKGSLILYIRRPDRSRARP